MKPGEPGVRESVRRRQVASRYFRRWFHSVEVGRFVLGTAAAAILIALTVLHLVPDKVSLNIGDVATTDIRAPHAARYEDTVATQELRRQLLSTVSREYESDPYAVPIAESTVNRIFTRLEMARSQETGSAALDRAQRLRDQIAREFGPQLSIEGVRMALGVQKPVFDLLQATTREWVLAAMRRPGGIREGTEDIQEARREITARAESLPV
ncbi:MAG: hypothetical protein QHJ73_18950, partial [Armatimonadota bacterium]|nr:hypothetical protein [Armatimonadota bacterium]